MVNTRYPNPFTIGALGLPLALIVTACGNGGEGDNGGETTISFSSVYTPESPITACGYDELDGHPALEEANVNVNATHSSQLGNENELLEQASGGQVDVAFGTGSSLATVFGLREMEMYDTFFLYEDLDQYRDVLATDAAQEMWDQTAEEAGIQALGDPWLYGERHMFGNTPIRDLEDFSGTRARTTPVDIYVDSLEALGASPTTTAFDEIYISLQQGIFDVGEAPLSVIQSDSFDEPSDYVSLTGHLLTGIIPMINTSTWDTLSSEQQEALGEAFDDASARVETCVQDADEEALQEWEDSSSIEVISDVDIEPMREAVRESYTQDFPWSEQYQTLLDEME